QLRSPGEFRTANRPDFGNRPGLADASGRRPSFGDMQLPSTRPSLPGQIAGSDQRPGMRPGTGDLAGIGNRPGSGGGGQQFRPGDGLRPGQGAGDQFRPGNQFRPDNRPGQAGDRWSDLANRPVIGGGNGPLHSGVRPGSDAWSTWHGGGANTHYPNGSWGWT